MSRKTFYTTERLGPKQSLTPEGFLLCEEVAIARTGMMVYGPDETPIKEGPDGYVKIFRNEEDVFSPVTIASAQGKPVTNEHPDDDVDPSNWKELTHGIAMNVRRGIGAQDDLLLADFLITTEEGIKVVQSGKTEVSCGYEADYEETAPGVGKQTDIVINHIALVDQGRCGPRCAISDHKPEIGVEPMAAKKSKMLDALMRAFKAKDAEEVEKLAEEVHDEDGDGEEAHIHIHNEGGESAGESAGEARFTDDDEFQAHVTRNDAEHAEMFARIEELEKLVAAMGGGSETAEDAEIEGQFKEEAPEGTNDDEVMKAKDSAYLGDSFRDTVALAEILVPGIKIPTYDRAADPKKTFRQICNLRRQALDLAYVHPATRAIVSELVSGKTLDTGNMTCDAVRTMFRSAAALRRSQNNSATHDSRDRFTSVAKPEIKSLADINKMNAAIWHKQ